MIYDGLSYLKEYRTLEQKKGVKKRSFCPEWGGRSGCIPL